MDAPDWRSADAYRHLETADPADFAWEFLRRNEAYRHDWSAATRTADGAPDAMAIATAARWGLAHLVDPSLGFAEAEVQWSPHVFARGLLIASTPDGVSTAPPLSLEALCDDVSTAIVRTGRSAFRLQRVASSDGGVAALIAPLDGNASVRLREASAFVRRLETGGRWSPPDALTRQQWSRLALELRALDGALAGASYRDVAAGLFGRRAAIDGPAWKTHDLRSRTIRLVRDARTLTAGAYRRLLRIPPRG